MNKSQQKNYDRALFIGRPELIFDTTKDFLENAVKIAPGIEDAAEILKSNYFDTIVLPISVAGLHLHSNIYEIIKLSPESRFILLAEMFEEPLALSILNSCQVQAFKCEYHILPMHPEELKTILAGDASQDSDKLASSGSKDAKIRLLERLVTEDDLTGIKNRRYIKEFLTQILFKAKAENFQVTLMIFDIDNFKSYNDTYGHYVGDEILKQASMLMKRCCRTQDVLGRIGGDEFAVVFWDCPISIAELNSERRTTSAQHPKEVLAITQRFMKELNTANFPFLGKDGKGTLTISGGLASFPHDGTSPEELFHKADNALLDAKANGKNRVYLVGKPE